VTLVDKIAEKLGIQTQEDWYSVTYNVFVQNGGSAFIQKHYRASLHRALSNVYPQFIWYPWKFTNSPKGFWPLPEHRRSFFLWLEEELEIKHPTDWYRVRTSDIVERGGGGVLQFYYNESLHKALKVSHFQ
jgi:spermidine synthase